MLSINLLVHRFSRVSAAHVNSLGPMGFGLSLLLLSCTTSLSAQRVGENGVVDGVPLRLPVANFIITETPASADKPSTYALGLVQSPSADELYSVRLKPGLMGSSDVTFALGEQGQLTGLNTSSSPAVAPVIKALGEFVVGVVDVGAKMAAAGMLDVRDRGGTELVGELEETKQKTEDVCSLRSDLRRLQEKAQADRSNQSAYQTAVDSCKKSVPDLLGPMVSRLKPDLDLAANLARLYPTNETQRAALEATAARLRTYRDEHMGSAEAVYPGGGEMSPDIEQIEAAIAALSKPAVAAVKPEEANPDGLAKLARVKAIAIATIDKRRLAMELAQAARLSAREWRSRQATTLEDRIEALGIELAVETELDPRKLAAREQLQREWAVTVDGLAEFERAEILRRLLLRAPAKLAEYAIARTELDVLTTTLAQKRQVLRPSMGAPAKAQPRVIRVVPEHYDGGGPSTKEWVAARAKAQGNPEFIIVVEHGVVP